MGAVVSWREAPALGDAGAVRAFATLAEATRVLLHLTSEQELLQQMCDAVCLAGGYPFSWYGRPVHEADQSVEVLAVGGDDRGYTSSIEVRWGRARTGQGPTGRALRIGATQVANNLAENPRFAGVLSRRARGAGSWALPGGGDGSDRHRSDAPRRARQSHHPSRVDHQLNHPKGRVLGMVGRPAGGPAVDLVGQLACASRGAGVVV